MQKIEETSQERATLSGGSQARTRLLGGYFVDPKHLPVRVDLQLREHSSALGHELELKVGDDFGLAVRDQGLEERFLVAAEAIQGVVDGSLDGLSSA